MIIYRFKQAGFLYLLGACSPAEVAPLPTLSAEQKVQRMQLCMGEIGNWRDKDKRVWIHGGVEPAVNRDAWVVLSNDEQQVVADIAACIKTSGELKPVEVQIVSEGFKVPIEKIQSENSLFAEKFK